MYFTAPLSEQKRGADLIAKLIRNAPKGPGVYRMIDDKGKVLYVGKAKNLFKRLQNYCDLARLPSRNKVMVGKTFDIEIITTKSEADALLLEANLIKHFKPRYNILLKDDKSFPYIHIRLDHPFPQITKYRGKKDLGGNYFGPFASAKDVNHTITYLQKIFLIRPCTDSYFAARKRPCIQYDIKRCSAPCVGKISKPDYTRLINQTVDFLQGKLDSVKKQLQFEMASASDKTEYEIAATLRDRIKALNTVTASSSINYEKLGCADVIGIAKELGQSCIQIFFFRAGQNYGNKSYFPIHNEDATDEEIIDAFLGKFYQLNVPPNQILLPIKLSEQNSLANLLSIINNAKVKILTPSVGSKRDVVTFATENAKASLMKKIKDSISKKKLLAEVGKIFDLKKQVTRIEVYDNSHISGSFRVGAMIVASPEGFEKNQYRKYNFVTKDLEKSNDDYGMMKEMLERRFRRLTKLDSESEDYPSLMLIDGGRGHLTTAIKVKNKFKELDNIVLVAIAKGEERDKGKEVFHLESGEHFTLPRDLPVMKYLQILRDEAHRFAITSHRKKREKSIRSSILDGAPSIGPKRKKALLMNFGSVEKIIAADAKDIAKVAGFSLKLAEELLLYLRSK